jgi:hypothetical protein
VEYLGVGEWDPVTDHEHRSVGTEGLRGYFLALGPEGRHHLAVALAWLTLMLTLTLGCGIVIGILI